MSSINSNPNLHKAAITWTIDDFPSVEDNRRNVQSPDFAGATYDKVTWHLVLDPDGEKGAISLYLYPHVSNLPSPYELYATFTAHILTNNGGKTPSKKTKINQYAKRQYSKQRGSYAERVGWGWINFLTKDENFRTNLLPNNALTICVEVVFSTTHSVVMNSCDKTLLRTITNNCKLIENLSSLLETQAFSDVVLCTSGKDFPAHKVILAARSKVFAAMFFHDTKEKQLNRVEIEDLSEETLAEMLRFIYTGKCEKLDELVEELLAAADKYDLDVLKITCCKALYKTLSAQNASHVLILADTFNAEELKNDVIEFIVPRAFDVMKTAGWKNVLPKSELVDEVCQALASYMVCEVVKPAPYRD